jgi:tRNA threonylcarbamoyladenosine biosynthesis protein TsaE
MKKAYFTAHPNQTKKLGEIVAKKVLKIKRKRRAQVLGLEGDLGGGKTTFLKGFAKGLGIKEKILSPTFIIMRKFKIRANSCSNSCKFVNFYHIDCYRIEKSKEILDLGFKEIIQNPKNIVAIEWADRVRQILPEDTIVLKFHFANKNKRKIMIRLKDGEV